MPDPSPQLPTAAELSRLYEDGKHRRYSLLFAINGGAFAIAKLMTQDCGKTGTVGALRLWQLSLGMVLMTAVMVYDIYAFGDKMSEAMSEAKMSNAPKDTRSKDTFTAIGKTVLILLGLLIIAGWALVGFAPNPQ